MKQIIVVIAALVLSFDLRASTPPPGSVDLGIVILRLDGTKYKLYWAKSNLTENGLCSSPEDYGDYYAWGELEPHYSKGHSQDNPCNDWRIIGGKTITGYDWSSYKWYKGGLFTKYNNNAWYGTVDNKFVLTASDDVARAKLGGKWRMPTVLEWAELIEQCDWTWMSLNGVDGYKVTGPNGNSIFLPASGYRSNTDLNTEGSTTIYWSSSFTGYHQDAWSIYFDSVRVFRYSFGRCCGTSIRPVSE